MPDTRTIDDAAVPGARESARGPVAPGDPTRIYGSESRPWIPFAAPEGRGELMVLHVDEERGVVVFRFRFASGTRLTPHTHRCHAIAYTVSGEWEYEGLKLPEGSIAYEPVDSTHTPSSGPGAELFVVLTSDTDQFLIEHLPDGSDGRIDLAFFRQLDGLRTPAEVEAFLAAAGDEGA